MDPSIMREKLSDIQQIEAAQAVKAVEEAKKADEAREFARQLLRVAEKATSILAAAGTAEASRIRIRGESDHHFVRTSKKVWLGPIPEAEDVKGRTHAFADVFVGRTLPRGEYMHRGWFTSQVKLDRIEAGLPISMIGVRTYAGNQEGTDMVLLDETAQYHIENYRELVETTDNSEAAKYHGSLPDRRETAAEIAGTLAAMGQNLARVVPAELAPPQGS